MDIKKRLVKDRPTVPVAIRIPEDVLQDLKRVAHVLGFTRHEALLRHYIGQGLRADLARLEATPEGRASPDACTPASSAVAPDDSDVKELRELSLRSGGRSRGWKFDREEIHRRSDSPDVPPDHCDETVEAMNAARRGELVVAGSPDKLLESLNAPAPRALREIIKEAAG